MRTSAEPIVLLADALAVVEAAGYVLVRRETGLAADPLMECVERAGTLGGEVAFLQGEVRRLRGALAECRRATEAKPAWVDGGIHYSELRLSVRAATKEVA